MLAYQRGTSQPLGSPRVPRKNALRRLTGAGDVRGSSSVKPLSRANGAAARPAFLLHMAGRAPPRLCQSVATISCKMGQAFLKRPAAKLRAENASDQQATK